MTDAIQQQLLHARKNQILDAAAALFAAKGFHPTTTKDIAKQAGISEGTIYKYFTSKTELLLGIFERMMELSVRETVPKAQEAPDFATFLRMYLNPSLALSKDELALFRIIISETMVNEELRTRYEQEIFQPTLDLDEKYLQEQSAKYGLSLPQAGLTVRFIAIMMLGLMMERILSPQDVEAEQAVLLNYVIDLIASKREETRR
jgi:AcrR family transcriptional regulator